MLAYLVREHNKTSQTRKIRKIKTKKTKKPTGVLKNVMQEDQQGWTETNNQVRVLSVVSRHRALCRQKKRKKETLEKRNSWSCRDSNSGRQSRSLVFQQFDFVLWQAGEIRYKGFRRLESFTSWPDEKLPGLTYYILKYVWVGVNLLLSTPLCWTTSVWES